MKTIVNLMKTVNFCRKEGSWKKLKELELRT